MTALADNDALDAQIERRLADACGDALHVLVAADEDAEIGRLGGVGAERPADAGLMKHLAVADEPVDVGLGEEVRRRRDEQNLSALLIEGEANVHPGILLDVLFQPFEGIGQRRRRQTQVVADLVNLGDDLVGVLLADPDGVEDLPARHGDLRRVDTVGAVHRAAAALRALVVVTVPVLDDLLAQIHGPDQLRKVLARHGEVAPVNVAQQILPRHRHVLGITRAEVVVTLVGAGAAFDAGIEENLQRAVLPEQLAHLVECDVLPVLDQLSGIAQRRLVFRLGDKGLGVRHGVDLHGRNLEMDGHRGGLHLLLAGCGLRHLPYQFTASARRRRTALPSPQHVDARAGRPSGSVWG